MKKLIKGYVRAVPTIITNEGKVNTNSEKIRSITIINKGTSNVILYDPPNEYILEPKEGFVLGGYDDSLRQDDFNIRCDGGVGEAFIFYDRQVEEPEIV